MTIKESCFLNSSTFTTKNSECSSSRTKYSRVGRYSSSFKQKVINEVQSGKTRTYVAKKYQLSYHTLLFWMRKARLPVEPTPVIKESLEKETYSLDFKQKVVSEVCSGQHINQVCKNHNIDQSNLHIWLKQAYSPNFPYNSSAAWTDEP